MEPCHNYYCHHCHRWTAWNSRMEGWNGEGCYSYSHISTNPIPVIQISVDMSYMKMMMCLPSQHDFKTSFTMFFFTGVPMLLNIDIFRCHNNSNFSGLLLSSSASVFAPVFLLHWLHFSVRPVTHLFRLWLYWTVHSTLHVAATPGTLLCIRPDTLSWAHLTHASLIPRWRVLWGCIPPFQMCMLKS